MFVAPGSRLGAYDIVALLGAGGMGEVYRAHDTKLNRDVALKVLPEAFASNPERLARFTREAQMLAALNHPHIAQIHGLEESNGVRALVMELVDGEDLAARISQGPVPIDEALSIARQIADALEAAHELGIIHRDLKPANIKVRPDGAVKVLDFGLAKAIEPASSSSAAATPANVSTITSPVAMTAAGVILGSAAYMAPEQARGKTVDKRADIWAFGCVLYEMLAGRRAFGGDEVPETLAFVITKDPDWTALPAGTPAAIRTLLRRCLEKDRKRRLADIADARLEIQDATPHGSGSEPPIASGRSRREAVGWGSALAALTLTAAAAVGWIMRPAPPLPEMRVDIVTPPTADPVSLALSPDGQKIVFVASADGRRQVLWLRSLDTATARPLARTEGATFPFWSPDSRSVGFFADTQLKRIDLDGGSVQVLAGARIVPNGGAWSPSGDIFFSQTSLSALFRVRATGGAIAAATQLDVPRQTSHSFPQFLPDGQHLLYYVRGAPEARGVYVARVDGSESHLLFDADAAAVYAPAAQRLFFVRQGTLFAQAFDPVSLTVSGNPSPVAEQVATLGDAAMVAAVSASAAGPIAYRTGAGGGVRQFEWVDRSGQRIATVGERDNTLQNNPEMSPDGRQVAFTRLANGNADVWLLELVRGVLTRFTTDAANDTYPIWSPDGTRIVFASRRRISVTDLYAKPTTGAGGEEPLLTTNEVKIPSDWSRDGRFIVYRNIGATTGPDIWALPLDAHRAPFPVVQTNFAEKDAQFSPDGKWIAYESDESGRYEIYVQQFPGPAGRQQISAGGGVQARWRSDGRELFYITPDNRLVAVPIAFAEESRRVEAGAAVSLFVTHVGGAVQAFRQQYVVSPDGRRFLINSIVDEGTTTPITIILNWKPRA